MVRRRLKLVWPLEQGDPEPVTCTPQEEDTGEPITSRPGEEFDGYRPQLTPRNLFKNLSQGPVIHRPQHARKEQGLSVFGWGPVTIRGPMKPLPGPKCEIHIWPRDSDPASRGIVINFAGQSPQRGDVTASTGSTAAVRRAGTPVAGPPFGQVCLATGARPA